MLYNPQCITPHNSLIFKGWFSKPGFVTAISGTQQDCVENLIQLHQMFPVITMGLKPRAKNVKTIFSIPHKEVICVSPELFQ